MGRLWQQSGSFSVPGCSPGSPTVLLHKHVEFLLPGVSVGGGCPLHYMCRQGKLFHKCAQTCLGLCARIPEHYPVVGVTSGDEVTPTKDSGVVSTKRKCLCTSHKEHKPVRTGSQKKLPWNGVVNVTTLRVRRDISFAIVLSAHQIKRRTASAPPLQAH